MLPTSTTSGVSSTVIEKGALGVVEAPSVNKDRASSSVEVPTHANKVTPSSFPSATPPKGCGLVFSLRLMPILATFYHHDDGTALPFVVPTPNEVRHYFVEPIALG